MTQNSFFTDLISIAPAILIGDAMRYVFWASLVFFFVNGFFSPWLSGRLIRPRNIPRGQIKRELLTSARTVLIFASVSISIWIGVRLGILRFYEDPMSYGGVWLIASSVLLIVLHDAWFYWTHRIIHDPRLFRMFHRTHHKSQTPTPFTSYAFDPGEAILNAVFLLLVGALMPLSYIAVFVFLTHMMVRNVVGHCGYELFPRTRAGKPLLDWITTVTHHDLHHQQAGWNYGLYFTFWDRVMGTEHPEYYKRFAAAVRRGGSPINKASSGAANALMLLIVGFVVLNLIAPPPSHAQNLSKSDPLTHIEGQWATQGYGGVVKLRACTNDNKQLCGDLIWAWDPDDVRPGSLDTEMLTGLEFKEGRWRNGRLKNPEDGRTYRGSILQVADDVLQLRGCAGPFCRNQNWRRLQSLPHLDEHNCVAVSAD